VALPPGSIWLDAQGAQNRVHFDRGIARYVSELLRALLALAPDAVRAVGLNASHPLTANLESVLGSDVAVLRSVRQGPPAPMPALYHAMSPFELDRSLDELWPEWARVPRVATVVTLFDVIPLVFEDHYLRDPVVRARYQARANLVRAADHVLAISAASAADATELLGVPPERITVIDAGVANVFVADADADAERAGEAHDALRARFPEIRDGFMLYVAGIDFRKNLERLIEAYGLMAPDLRARHQLVITCKALPEERAHLERVAAEAGLRPGELVVTGYVTDSELRVLYRLARLFVFASFYEGSGLPILEAMASDLPVAASNTSTSPEILGDLEATFDPFDPHDMARVLSETVVDDAVLARLRERSRGRVRGYTWEHVAERTLEGYERALARRGRRTALNGRPRLALVTPWPPERSGVADYTARLAGALAAHADVDIVVDGDVADHVEPAAPGARLVPYESHAWWARSLRVYDSVLYSMGNSSFHGWIYEAMKARPGVLVAHDVRLTGFYGWYAGRERPEDPAGRLMERIHAMYGDRVDWRRWRAAAPTPEEQEAFGLNMTHEVQEYAHAAIVHSRHAAEVLRLERTPDGEGPPVHVIPHAMPPVLPAGGERWADPLIVSFGVLSHVKGLRTLVEAFAQLAAERPEARLILAGYGEPGEVERWVALARELGVGDRVEVPGYVTAEQYDDLLAQARVAVQLRLTYNGEASGAVAHSLAAGLPTIVTDIGWFAELPRDAVVHVPPGVTAGRLAAEIGRVLGDERHAAALAAAGRRHAELTSFASVARRYIRAVLEPPRAREPEPELAPAPVTVVITTQDRCDRLLLTLEALERQTRRDFAVVVADDSSSDDTVDEVERLAHTPAWRGRLAQVRLEGGPHGAAAPRNAGARCAAPGTSLLLSLDADLLLAPDAIQVVADVHRRHPDAVVLGQVHWLEPLDVVEVAARLRHGGVPALVPLVPRGPARRVDGTIVGVDPRGASMFHPAAGVRPAPVEPESALSGLMGIPAAVYAELGGYDDSIEGYGYEDMEFGVRLAGAGVSAVAVSDLFGLHVWHAKHDWDALSLTNERNLDFVLRKHGPDATSDAWADWSVWWHYHAEREGTVARGEDGRLWAIDRGERVRLELPSEDWIERLGHAPGGVRAAAAEVLERLRVAGVAEELRLDRTALGPARAG
jgi:glycosyltransferase involved in cell wall biosynthesis